MGVEGGRNDCQVQILPYCPYPTGVGSSCRWETLPYTNPILKNLMKLAVYLKMLMTNITADCNQQNEKVQECSKKILRCYKKHLLKLRTPELQMKQPTSKGATSTITQLLCLATQLLTKEPKAYIEVPKV